MTDSTPLEPPTGLAQTLRYLGPGLLVAATVVGAGELIATTRTGAQAGIAFLWLIILGSLIKVFVQVELGRHTISSGETTLTALNRLPGPRLRANWVIWIWLALMPASFVIMGGVIGGVGQAFAIGLPVRGDYAEALAMAGTGGAATFDDRFWATAVAGLTSVLLVVGRYRLIERLAFALVALFTLVTIASVVILQDSSYRLPLTEILHGLAFTVPDMPRAWVTALATFGIIGVGAVDLIAYPYWCLEKGYARFAGENDGSRAWQRRARGWIRVMRKDAFVSVLVCTVATVSFYYVGAAVLHPAGLDPDGMRMISTLIEAYVPVFGDFARWLLVAGAIAVLYSSFLVATAAGARLLTDGGFILSGYDATANEALRTSIVKGLSFVLCYAALGFYLAGRNPATLILIGGLAQTILLPVVGFASVYLRYRHTDPALQPGRAWDAALFLSCLGFVVIGLFGLYRIFGVV